MVPRTFSITDSFVIRGRGTVLIGPRASEIPGLIAIGDTVEVCLADGARRSRVTGIERFQTDCPQADPPMGILLADDIGKVPGGTAVRPAP